LNGVAIVTGASSGIGRATALRLAKDGYDIGVVYGAGRERAEEVAAEIIALGRRTALGAQDLTRPATAGGVIDALANQLGRLDLFVNNAGVNRRAAFLDETIADWERVIAVNLTGAFVCGQRAARRMIAQGAGGCIINVSSILEREVLAGGATYCASKGGLAQLTRAMALELAPHGVRVNGVAPGETATPMNFATAVDAAAVPRPVTPLGRPGYSEEVAEVIAFLGAKASSYITGEIVLIDGGLRLHGGPHALQLAVGKPREIAPALHAEENL
jgi:NAD(P)-dependent dehydrogenase (short-subunit alcohol dehydrogenase family)